MIKFQQKVTISSNFTSTIVIYSKIEFINVIIFFIKMLNINNAINIFFLYKLNYVQTNKNTTVAFYLKIN